MPIQLCTRVMADGHTCGSPALRGERLCYYHHPSRSPNSRPRASRRAHQAFVINPPTNRQEFQQALGQILRRLGANKIDPKRASVLLYTLQLAGRDFY